MSDATTPDRAPNWGKRIGLGLLALLGLILLAVLGLWLWINSSAGRDFVEARIEGLEIAGQTVAIDGLDGSVLGGFGIDRLVLTDREGDWLIARDVQVDWSPRALLSKRLQVDALRVGDLDVLAQPVLVQGAPSEDPRITTFAFDDVALPDVSLAEPVIGQALQMQASGALRHGPDGGTADVLAKSDQGDRVVADLDWSPLLVLSGEAEVSGPAGGLLASLLRLDPDQSVSADVTTQDSVTQVKASINGAGFADLAIERGQSRVSVSGTVDPDPVPMLASVQPLLGGPARIDAVLPLDQGAPATVELRAPRLSLDAAGTRNDGTVQLSEVRLEADSLLQGFGPADFAVGRLVAEGRATIDGAYSFEGQVTASDMAYRDYRVDRLDGPLSLRWENSVLDFNADMTGTASQGVAARANGASLKAVGQLDMTAQTVSLSQADIDLPGLALRGTGTVGYGETPSARFEGRYDVDTKIFRDEPSARLRGLATVETTANGPVIDLTGRTTRIEGLAEAVEPLAQDGLDYTARLRMQDGQVLIPRFTASNALVNATGSGRWRNGRIAAEIDYTVTQYDFAAVSAQDVSGTATLSGPVADIAFETDLTVETLQTGALTTTNADITANGTYAGGVIETAGTLAADSEQGRVTTSGDITLQNGEWTVSNIEGALGDLSTTGNLSGIGGDIAAIRGDLVLSGTSPLIPAESVEANIRLGDARVDVDALLEGLTVWRIQDATVQVTAVGPRDAVDFTVGMEGKTQVRDVTRDLSMTATGTADLRQESLSAQTGFDMTMGRLELAGEAQATRQDEGWAGSLDAQGLGGAMALSLTPGADGAVEFDLDSLSVPQLAALLARPATEGSVSGQGRFAVVGESVEGDAMLTLADLRSPISDADAVTIQTEINLADERLRIATQATEGGLEGSARLVGPVETLPRAPYIVFPPAVPLQGRADLSGEIGPVAEIFLPPLTDVAGRIESDLRFTVPHTPAALKGRVEVTDGVFEQGSVGLRLREMSLLAELDGEIITVPRLSARGADGGSLEGSGRMGLGDATGTVNVRAEKLRVVDRREGHAEVSGELDISRTTELLKLGGELQVTDAEINIARLPEPGLPTLEIDFGEETEEEEPKGFAATATEMDIRITSNGRIEVTGRGLDALMSLDASVVGPFNDPVITGDMSVDRGRFDFLSKRFEFRDSSVTIRDDIMQSALNFEAIRRTPDLTAVVSISGTLDRPEIDLRSEPNLPEDEVLARILFGRSPTQLSAIEAARLAAALAQLSGGSGFDLFGSLENAIGLDTLDIGRNDTGQTQLTTGKYLSDNVYLEVRTAAEGTPGIAVEWQVRDNITVEGETVPNERERLSVQWKKDFD